MHISFVVHSFPKWRMASLFFLLSSYILLIVSNNNVVVFGHSGKLQPMIIPTNGWIAIEVITAGDNILNPTSWAVPDYMDGIGAFLLDDSNLGGGGDGPTLRINVNHEHDDEATISEININKGKLKDAIYSKAMNTFSAITNDFVQSARMAYDKLTTDGGNTWSTNVDKSSTRFCRFCSSQYLPANAFGNTNSPRGFQDNIYITGEECDDGRLFALDVNNDKGTRDLYVVSGITGSMPLPLPLPSQLVPPTTSASAWDDDKFGGIPRYEEGNGGMPFDSWENAAIIDTGETNHIALLLSADMGTETLKLYIGRKNTDSNGQPNTINFLARNGLLYGRYYYLGGLDWNEIDGTGLWDTPPGRFVTDEDDGWSEGKFEDIDTNPNNPTQVVLAESNSGVYILTFNLKFRDNNFVNDADSGFTVEMITNFNQEILQWPDNVDWTKNNLIFVNKDDYNDGDNNGGIWYMNPDGSGKTTVGQTRDGGESTGILDISELLNYPPASTIITTNQGTPSSMTLLLNPTLKQFLVGGDTQPINPAVVVGPSPTNPQTTRPRPQPQLPSPILPPPVPPPTLSPTLPYPTTTSTSPPAATTAQPPVVIVTKPIILPWNDDNKDECPVGSDNVSSFQVIQAEDVTLYSGLVKTKRKNYCGKGYVDFEHIPDIYGSPGGILGSGNGVREKDPIFTSKDGIVQRDDEASASASASSRQGIDIVGVSFVFEINYPGMYSITVRYANGGELNSNRPGTFLVDGIDINNDFIFETTFGWDIWSTEQKNISLDTSGRHILDLFWIEVKNRPNLDWLSIELIQQQQ